ncbi:putative extracellular sulfatase Sulf-1 homolog [Uloborus diversus]|uniref:putative extracellular sulfatase Sulf-1 homolog n=1 Tax=Uloborus diversus TaxID=327109 RepID=UPI002409D60D|nr:putative extracellular sulfatase Sulf-1 homolog [Uloborus diversus]
MSLNANFPTSGPYDYEQSRFPHHGFVRKDGRNRKTTQLLRDKKPNIILVLTDDQDIELGSMNFMPKTLRILGDGGAHFSNAYVTTPMCCPSRSSLLTGLYVHNHQVHTNNDNCSSPWWQQEHETRTFATYLNNAGYRTAYFGKYLNEYNGSYIPPGWREWVALIRNSRFYNYSINVNGNKIKHGDNYFKDYYPDLIANDSINFLRRSKRHFVNKPVMMVLSFPSPHGPEDAAPQYQNLFQNVTTHRTPSWNFAPNPDKQWLLRNTGKMEPIHVKFTDVLHTKRLQTLQSVDDAVEKLYRELRLLGELENTYIFYTSDHGYHLGQFGLVKGKSMPFEFDVRVPFFVRGPRVPRGVRIQDIVLNIDLAPTFLDIAGVDVPDHIDGRSVLSLLKDADAWASSGHRHTEVKRKRSWRDTFLIERGIVNSQRKNAKNMYPSLSPVLPKLTKDQRLAVECKKAHYSSPCKLYQKWECIHDGYRWRIQKCRLHFSNPDNCLCPDRDNDDFLDWNMEELQRRPDVLMELPAKKRKHVERTKFLIPKESKFPGIPSRWKRFAAEPEIFDVEGIEQLYQLLDATVGTRTESKNISNAAQLTDTGTSSEEDMSLFTESSVFEERDKRETPASFQLGIHNECILLPNGSRTCFDDGQTNPLQWQEKKERLDGMIKKLRQKLEELKVIRKQLKKTKPSAHKNYFSTDLYDLNPFNPACVCDPQDQIQIRQQLKDERRQRREDLKRERQLRKEEHLKKLGRKLRRKTKFENMTCNAEKMNCFTQDNNHWKTPPLWTEGPFCFCQNANNNTFWCLRTINETHNFLYCEFVTGFITFYDLRTDPYQMRNAIYDLDYGTLEKLRMQLNHLRSCKGSKECTVRHRFEGQKPPHRQRAAVNARSRSIRHWKNDQRWANRKSSSWPGTERQSKWK